MTEKTFADLGLSREILSAVAKKGFTKPSPIQAGVIPLLLNGNRDIIGQAQTGTGKTAAFALPLLMRLDPTQARTQAIVLAPTRELAIQVAKEIESFSVPKSPSVMVVYGGNQMGAEIAALKRSPQIVVGTPGRMQHHIRNKNLRLDNVRYFILDEADEMLNFGFREEIEKILQLTPPGRRVLLFSATMPRSILNIVNNYMGDHDMVKVAAKEMTNENIFQKYYCVHPRDKFEALCRIMEDEKTFYAIVFCRTKSDTDLIASQLAAKHLRAEGIHGDIDQAQREKVLARFRDGRTNILVATDVAARGLDINDLNFVVNYSLPESFEAYTHRIGRTGRAGKTGVAITFVTKAEMRKLRFFEQNLKVRMEKGTLPSPARLIAKKQESLIERLEHIINTEGYRHLLPVARQLLEEEAPEVVLSALLRDSYGDDFDPKSYREIREEEPVRSFPAKGKPQSRPRAGGQRAGGKGRNRNSGGRSGPTGKKKRRR